MLKAKRRRHLTKKQLKYFGTRKQREELKEERSEPRGFERREPRKESRRFESKEHRLGYSSKRKRVLRSHVTRRKATARKRSTKASSGIPTWLTALTAGGAGLSAGTAVGTLFGDQIKSTLSKVPVIGNLFKSPSPIVTQQVNATPEFYTIPAGNTPSDMFSQAMTPGSDLNSLIAEQNSAYLSSADYMNQLEQLVGSGGF